MVLLLRSGVRRREDSGAAPESEALQVPCLPKEALYSRRHGHPRPSGPQRDRHQVRNSLFRIYFHCISYCIALFVHFYAFMDFSNN